MTGAPFLRMISLDDPEREHSVYPFGLPMFSRPFALAFESAVTVISGENGSGKSTILEAIADHCGFAASGGSRNHNSGARSDVAPLADAMRFSWQPKVTRGFFFRAETLFNFSGYLDDLAKDSGDIAYVPYGGKSLHAQSHGEAFLSVLSGLLQHRGIFLLDEPEAALSPQRQLQLLAFMHQAARSRNAQIIMTTHSPLLMCLPEADIIEIRNGHFERVTYRETQNFKLYKRFFDAPETLTRVLFEDI